MAERSDIATPVTKATSALVAGAGSSVTAISAQAGSFLPTDAAGWMALLASAVALIYTLCLASEWWWKRVWRPMFVRAGWVPPAKGITAFRVDGDGNVTREDT